MERRKLLGERDYHVDRLADIKAELSGLFAEAAALKAELEAVPAPDNVRVRAIQRRRRYIARRSADLKAERETSIVLRDSLKEQLKREAVP